MKVHEKKYYWRLWPKRLDRRQLIVLNFLFGGMIVMAIINLVASLVAFTPAVLVSAIIFALILQLIDHLTNRYQKHLYGQDLQTIENIAVPNKIQVKSATKDSLNHKHDDKLRHI